MDQNHLQAEESPLLSTLSSDGTFAEVSPRPPQELSPIEREKQAKLNDEELNKARKRWIFNYAAIFWLTFGIGAGAAIGVHYILPALCESSPGFYKFNVGLLFYGLGMLVMSWAMIRWTDVRQPGNAVRRRPSPSTTPGAGSNSFSTDVNPSEPAPASAPTLDFCRKCNLTQAPRTHHCNLCQICIQGHDHHCFFAAFCVGHRNQRYFMIFTFWLSFGLLYSLCIFIKFLWSIENNEFLKNLAWIDFIFVPIPILKFIFNFRTVTLFDLLMVFLLHSLLVGSYASVFLFVCQVYLVSKGLTSFMYRRGIPSTNPLSPLKRLMTAFGDSRLWFLQLIFPISPLFPMQPMVYHHDNITFDSLKKM